MASDINYSPNGYFFDGKTKAAKPVTPEQLQGYAQEIAAAYKGHPKDITVCVNVAQHEGDQYLTYTVNRNKTSPEIRAAADKLDIKRWNINPGTAGRGMVGAPGDAEQIAHEFAYFHNFRILAQAPSRAACQDCALALKRAGIKYILPDKNNNKAQSFSKIKSLKPSGKSEAKKLQFLESEPITIKPAQQIPKLNERGTAYKSTVIDSRQSRFGTGIRYAGGITTVLGLLYPYTSWLAMDARKKEEGYIPYGPEGYSNETLFHRIARSTLDPTLGNEIPVQSRFNVSTWRSDLYVLARSKKANDTILFRWQKINNDVRLGNSTVFKDIDIKYLKLENGRWMPLNFPIDLPEIPDLNYILNPVNSDEEVTDYLLTFQNIKA